MNNFNEIENMLIDVGVSITEGSVKKDRIDAIENKLSISFPDEYRQFLQKVEKYSFANAVGFLRMENTSNDSVYEEIDTFFGLDEGGSCNIFNRIMTYEGRIPEDIVPFADCSGGDLLCIGVFGDNLNKIFYWDHSEERLDTRGVDMYYNVSTVSDTFFDFVNSLQKIKEKEWRPVGIIDIVMTDEFLKLINKQKSIY